MLQGRGSQSGLGVGHHLSGCWPKMALPERVSRPVFPQGCGLDLRDSLEAEGVLTAFRQAIRTRRPAAGLMVHSDQGVQ